MFDRMRKSLLLTVGLAFLALVSPVHADTVNLLSNGGFEDGVNGWMWGNSKGMPQPGHLNRYEAAEGLTSYTLALPGAESASRFIGTSVRPVNPSLDYELRISLACEGVPEGALVVNLLQWGTEKSGPGGKSEPQGWVSAPQKSGVKELIRTGGTHPWKEFRVRLPAGSLKASTEHLILMVRQKHVNQGTVHIDAVSFVAIGESSEADAAVAPESSRSAQAPVVAAPVVPAVPEERGWTFDTKDPAVLVRGESGRLRITAEPELAIYVEGVAPRLFVHAEPPAGATVRYRLTDGSGAVAAEGTLANNGGAIELPSATGYYELTATIEQGGELIETIRRSLGFLTRIDKPGGEEPFGLWIQGGQHYAELGSRWHRKAIYHQKYEQSPEAYLAELRSKLDADRARGIRSLVFPKDFPNEVSLTDKVIRESPESWRVVEAYWTELIRGLAGHVDAWAIINEPYAGMWTGSDSLILRYWSLMDRLIEELDPGTPLLGPSLNVNKAQMMKQFRELVDAGLLDSLDGLELHTYNAGAMPADEDWAGNIAMVRQVMREAGKELPIYSSEMGISNSYEEELFQAQYTSRSLLWTKRLGLKMVMWHMFSWPQGKDVYQRNFAIFRNGTGEVTEQPRPAGVAYGVATRELSGADFLHEIDYLGPAVKAFVFEREGEPMLALWSLDPKPLEITLAAGDAEAEITDLFGLRSQVAPDGGLIRLTLGGSPLFVAGLPRHYLADQTLVRVGGPVDLLPGGDQEATLTVRNPTLKKAEIRLEPIATAGWGFELGGGSDHITLGPGEVVELPIRVVSPAGAALGDAAVYAKAYLNGRYVAPVAVPVRVLPPVELIEVRPGLTVRGDSALVGVLQRHDPRLTEAKVCAGGDRLSGSEVSFSHGDTARFVLPVKSDPSAKLQTITLRVQAGGKGRVTEQAGAYSFVPAPAVDVILDGELGEWPALREHPGFWIGWSRSEDAVQLALRVYDPVHVQGRPIDSMWKEDSIQIAFAPTSTTSFLRQPVSEMAESGHSEFSIALVDGEPRVHRSITPNSKVAPIGEVTLERIPVAIDRAGGFTTYEAMIPVRELGLQSLTAGQVLRVAALVNDSDGGGRSIAPWFYGINGSKDPQAFGHLILQGP